MFGIFKGPRTKQMENGFQWMWLKFEYDVVKVVLNKSLNGPKAQ